MHLYPDSTLEDYAEHAKALLDLILHAHGGPNSGYFCVGEENVIRALEMAENLLRVGLKTRGKRASGERQAS